MGFRTGFAATGITGIAVVAALSPGGAAASRDAETAQACVPSTNVEAVIDDSGSMSTNDFNELRRTGLELFIGDSANAGLTLGAAEFGEQGDTVFVPANVGTTKGAMVAALRARINADGAESPTSTGLAEGGGTDYNDGIARGFVDNRTATGRIFLTDGAHNEGEYLNVHRGGPPTYVVGLGIGRPSATNVDANRLQGIATETGGRYFPAVEGVGVQAVFNTIGAILGCRPVPKNITFPAFSRAGQTANRNFKPAKGAKRVGLVLNWAQPLNKFRISKLTAVGKNGRRLATLSGKGKPRKLSVSKRSSATFTSFNVKKPRGLRKFKIQVSSKRLSVSDQPLLQASNLGG